MLEFLAEMFTFTWKDAAITLGMLSAIVILGAIQCKKELTTRIAELEARSVQ